MKIFRFARLAALPLAVLLPLGAQQNAAQQNAAPQSEGITRQQAEEIINELRAIRQLLTQQQAKAPAALEQPQRVKLNLDGFQMLGSKSAPLTVVEFTDYQCPFCQRFHVTTFPELKKNYIDTGKVRFYSRDLPLDFHANAMRAAQSARCAAEQGKFWQLRDVMAANPEKLDPDHVVGFAADLKLDIPSFKACVDSNKYRESVQSDVMEAMKIGASGTPAFVVGTSTADGIDGEMMVGALPYQVFDEKLKSIGGTPTTIQVIPVVK
jgi:protein-disulfide isomerase